MGMQKDEGIYSVCYFRNAIPSWPFKSRRLGKILIMINAKSQLVCGELVGMSIGHRGGCNKLISAVL